MDRWHAFFETGSKYMYFHSSVLCAVTKNILQIKESFFFLAGDLSLQCQKNKLKKSITGVQYFEAKSKREGEKASLKY